MESISESLEKKVDWKQWIPVYGIYQIKRDLDKGKPTFNMSNIYHAMFVSIPIVGYFLFK